MKQNMQGFNRAVESTSHKRLKEEWKTVRFTFIGFSRQCEGQN